MPPKAGKERGKHSAYAVRQDNDIVATVFIAEIEKLVKSENAEIPICRNKKIDVHIEIIIHLTK